MTHSTLERAQGPSETRGLVTKQRKEENCGPAPLLQFLGLSVNNYSRCSVMGLTLVVWYLVLEQWGQDYSSLERESLIWDVGLIGYSRRTD